jgi:hypothetical protein
VTLNSSLALPQPVTVEANCRGCLRYHSSHQGKHAHYEFNSDPGWSPGRLIFDTYKLGLILAARPRQYGWDMPSNPSLWKMAENHEIYEEHLPHVDITKPSMLGEMYFTRDADNYQELFHLCVDGHHRMLRRMREGLRAEFYMMTSEEMMACAHPTLAAYMRTRGVFVVGVSDEEVDRRIMEIEEAQKR